MPIGRCGTEKGEPVGARTTHELLSVLGIDALCENFFCPTQVTGIAFTGVAFH